MNGYLKISDVSEKWGIKERRINTLCLEGRIEGAIKFGNTWAIPENAEKPKDERIKSGKYIKEKSMALKIKYGEEFELLNGFHETQLNGTDFIDNFTALYDLLQEQ